MHLSTRSGIKYIRLRSWCLQRNSTKRKTAIPNTLLHDNSNCRCVATIIELLMVLIFWGLSSFPGHMGMSPSVTWSGPISYSLLLISVEYTQQAYTISVDMFGCHFLCEGIFYSLTIQTSCALAITAATQAKRVAAMFVYLLVSVEWLVVNKNAIIGGKHSMFGKPLDKAYSGV